MDRRLKRHEVNCNLLATLSRTNDLNAVFSHQNDPIIAIRATICVSFSRTSKHIRTTHTKPSKSLFTRSPPGVKLKTLFMSSVRGDESSSNYIIKRYIVEDEGLLMRYPKQHVN